MVQNKGKWFINYDRNRDVPRSPFLIPSKKGDGDGDGETTGQARTHGSRGEAVQKRHLSPLSPGGVTCSLVHDPSSSGAPSPNRSE